jgi:hypothetical protein
MPCIAKEESAAKGCLALQLPTAVQAALLVLRSLHDA